MYKHIGVLLTHGFADFVYKSYYTSGRRSLVVIDFAAFFTGVLLLLAVLFVPVVRGWFAVEPVSLIQFGCIAVLAFAPTALIQIDRIYDELI